MRATICFATACACDPLILTTPRPPGPGGVAMATIVSSVENIGQRDPAGDHFLGEMCTVLEKASPMLSVVTPGISATAR